MVAKQKIEEAAYFLEKIKRAATRTVIVPNLSCVKAGKGSIASEPAIIRYALGKS